jgi:hypothetical protein
MPLVRITGPLAAPARHFAGDPRFLFLGNLEYPANAHGLQLFLRLVMPLFLSRIPAGRLMIVGAGASRGLRELGDKLGLAASFLDLCPGPRRGLRWCRRHGGAALIRHGRQDQGNRSVGARTSGDLDKSGLPVISTRFGIDGLDLEPGTHCLVEDDLTKFADAMVRLLDPAVNGEFARRGLAYYGERLAPEVVVRSYRKAIFGDGWPDRTVGANANIVS